MTGKGVNEFFEAVAEKAKEFERDYKPELERRRQERQKDKEGRREKELGKLMKDMNVSGNGKKSSGGLNRAKAAQKNDIDTISDIEDEVESDDEARMVEPDEDDMDEEVDEEGVTAGEGLTQRYKQALAESEGTQGGPSSEDHSFTRYLNATSMNG
ncbi:MAG: hypothetical protein LQ347_006689 [Umbilicaria vellea]|nr:MAG: hypothetical protein LQ347_006689 [Umbilicaria vellea]